MEMEKLFTRICKVSQCGRKGEANLDDFQLLPPFSQLCSLVLPDTVI